ncbi:hypothetical protein JVX88_00890 [Leptolyngbya sp. 7M]|nr:hypothetical protein [Leptolyngbya sp. 7M]QYO65371.1 hypothetical protein JVX88_00890 [Leptolyngbya sp. 7M]
MSRNATVLSLFVLFLVATALTLDQTIALRTKLGEATFWSAAIGEAIAMAVITAVAIAVFRKTYRRQKKPISREQPVRFQPLRRLFVSVWS